MAHTLHRYSVTEFEDSPMTGIPRKRREIRLMLTSRECWIMSGSTYETEGSIRKAIEDGLEAVQRGLRRLEERNEDDDRSVAGSDNEEFCNV